MVTGMLLTTVRDLTTASNLAFVFLLWTIVVAELGGRGAALATAVISALSLNVFLTKPYFRFPSRAWTTSSRSLASPPGPGGGGVRARPPCVDDATR
jgi:K+-sensing histidine kinase KdpD